MYQRQSLFGFPPPPGMPSTHTVRQVPLSTGVQGDAAWPILPPGSTISISNFLPIYGRLIPRSALSSLNTIASIGPIKGVSERVGADGLASDVWVSGSTIHGLMQSTGSISVASFVSAYGLGSASLNGKAASSWVQHATVYDGGTDQNVLLSTPDSRDTILMTYRTGGSGALLSSYLTSAPRAYALTTFDNYILAWNISGTGSFPTRIQWCARGLPSNWTGEGSGFEDLLEMTGWGTRVIGSQDGRVILFSDREIWYGVRAAYPSQFQFFPLEKSVGCPAQATVQDTEFGIIFLGSDYKLRVLPAGGGVSQVIASPLNSAMLPGRGDYVGGPGTTLNKSWGLYNPLRRLYYLFLDPQFSATQRGFVINMATGECGYLDYNSPSPSVGCLVRTPATSTWSGNQVYGNSSGSLYVNNPLLGTENGSPVTAKWQSPILASDLPGSYKLLTEVAIDYRATSRSTLTVKISVDGAATFDAGQAVSLTSEVADRALAQCYTGGAFPALELTSSGTGYELHRVDVTLNLGGRR